VSSYGAPDCAICGAHTDYCTLTTATGIDIDCRDLMLRNQADLAWNIELAKSMRDQSNHATGGEHDDSLTEHDLQVCGHPVAAIYSSDEGTSYCRTCEPGGAS